MNCTTLHGANTITFLHNLLQFYVYGTKVESDFCLPDYIVDLLDLYLCRTPINVIAMTCFLCVQVNSQNKEPNTEVTEQEELLHVFT